MKSLPQCQHSRNSASCGYYFYFYAVGTMVSIGDTKIEGSWVTFCIIFFSALYNYFNFRCTYWFSWFIFYDLLAEPTYHESGPWVTGILDEMGPPPEPRPNFKFFCIISPSKRPLVNQTNMGHALNLPSSGEACMAGLKNSDTEVTT